MGSEMSKRGMSESETFWPRFRRSIKRNGKKQSSKPSHFSNHAAEISPTRLNSGKPESSVRIVSIYREGELIPVILSPAGKTVSNDQQSAKKKLPLGFGAAEIYKLKAQDAVDHCVKSRESEVFSEVLAPKQISKEEEEISKRKLDRWSWDRIAKAFRVTTATNLYRTSQNGQKVSQDSQQGGHPNDTPVIDQSKAQEILAKVGYKIRKLLKVLGFCRKLRSDTSAPNSSFKRRVTESADPLSSSSPRKDTVATQNRIVLLNYQPKKKPTITGTSGEGYCMALNLSVLIIILVCLVIFSNKFLAILCTSIWWYWLSKEKSTDAASRCRRRC